MCVAETLDPKLARIINAAFSLTQQRMFADEFETLLGHGHGELAITVSKGHVRFLIPRPSLDFQTGDLQTQMNSDNVRSETE
jgi:hypothetical protein